VRYVLAVAGLSGTREPAATARSPNGRIPSWSSWKPVVFLAIALVGALGLVAAKVGSSRTLLLTPADRRLYELHGTWHRMFDWGLAERSPVLVWVLALVLVGAVGLPYVWLAASSLPDRGFAIARPTGLLLVGWLVWLLASVGLADFSRRSIGLAFVIVGAGGAALVAREPREFTGWLKARWRLIVVEELVFWTLFASGVLVRFANPDLWHPSRGGEKPMDLAFLNAVVKSTHFPPYDPWFGGGQLNYYYFGFVLMAVLVKLTSIAPYVAYNLAVPTLFAFLGCSAFGATLALVRVRSRGRSWRLRHVGAALVGTLFVAVLGNLGEIRVLIDRMSGPVPNDWWFWNASRVIHHPPTEPGMITEFPAFTYLFADLHAHAMALPYTVVLITMALSFLRADASRTRVETTLRFVLVALLLGSLWPLNTWDVPTYAVIAVLALAGAWYAGSRDGPLLGLPALALRAGLLLVLAYVLFLPFHRHYSGVFAGVDLWHGSRTRLNDYLTIHGLFLFAVGSALVVDLATANDLAAVPRAYRTSLRCWDRIGRFREVHRAVVKGSVAYRAALYVPPAAVIALIVLAALGEGVSAVVVGLGTLTALALVRRRTLSPDTESQLLWQAALVLFAIGLLITWAVEFFVAKRIDVGRTNTVFKFYVEVWVLWSLAAAAALYRVYGLLPRLPRLWRRAWVVAVVLLVATASLYPIDATRARIRDRFDTSVGATLNGLAFADKAVLDDKDTKIPLRYDAAAIHWMLRTVTGSPIVAEVNTFPTLYGWGDRFAMFTGNPTIVGWDYHERQQRPTQSAGVTRRITDVQTAYRTISADLANRIFRRYGVSYVVVGPLERAYFPQGQAKWRFGEGRYWHAVYRNPGVTIYKLN
jgi:YYY domain-containing protein